MSKVPPKAQVLPGKLAASAAKNPPLSCKERLHPQEYAQLKATFSLFDQDNSGTIDPEEINKIMEQLGEARKGTLVYSIIEGLKVKNKAITFDQFVQLVTPKVGDLKTKEGLRTVFAHLDADQDDYINYEELKHLAKLSGDMINDDQILELLHSIFISHKTKNNSKVFTLKSSIASLQVIIQSKSTDLYYAYHYML